MNDRRDDLHPWKNLEQLKIAYSKHLSSDKIDEVVSNILKTNKFKKRINATEEENNECFLNLVDSTIWQLIKINQ